MPSATAGRCSSCATCCAASGASRICRGRSPRSRPNLLADRLRRLEELGLIERRIYSRRPLRAEYELTEAGRGLAPVIVTLGRFGIDRLGRPEPDYLAAHVGCGGRVPPTAWRCLACGEEVRAGELELRPPAEIRHAPSEARKSQREARAVHDEAAAVTLGRRAHDREPEARPGS